MKEGALAAARVFRLGQKDVLILWRCTPAHLPELETIGKYITGKMALAERFSLSHIYGVPACCMKPGNCLAIIKCRFLNLHGPVVPGAGSTWARHPAGGISCHEQTTSLRKLADHVCAVQHKHGLTSFQPVFRKKNFFAHASHAAFVTECGEMLRKPIKTF